MKLEFRRMKRPLDRFILRSLVLFTQSFRNQMDCSEYPDLLVINVHSWILKCSENKTELFPEWKQIL